MVINAFGLSETFGNKTSLKPFNRAIRAMLDFVEPFAANGLLLERESGKGPCISEFQGINFRLHGLLPLGIRFSLCKRTGFHNATDLANKGQMFG